MELDAQTIMKQEVARAALSYVEPNTVVGLGSGSTAALFIEYLGERVSSGDLSGVVGVPTSFQARVLAREFGIPLKTLNEVDTIHVAVDGADEVDPNRNLIKGGGAAHTQEKLVDARAETFVVVVDASKLVDPLGSTFKLPVEVLPDAYVQVAAALEKLGGEPELRMAVRKAGPVVTDQGLLVLDVDFRRIEDPAWLEREINNIPGVLENGLFVDTADVILVGDVVDGQPSVREM